MIDLLNLSAGERVDLADLQFATQDSILAAQRALPESFLTDSSQQMWVVRGFQMSNPTGQVLQVSQGVALLALRQGTRILQGVLCADGPASQSIDLSSYAAATYNVYIRFVTTQGSFDTRTFWRESAGGQEYSQSVPTRLTGSWELAVQAASPGSEWLCIGQVVAPSLATTDMRPLYFEGRVDQGTASAWGSASDRSADRGNFGITSLQTALAALRQSIEDIKGQGIARWFTDHVAGQSIGYASSALAVGRTSWTDDQFYAQGDASAPGLHFASDGAQLVYRRATGLLVANGPSLGASAQSTTTGFVVRSGADDAMVRHGFYRATAATGSGSVDAAVARGVPGSATGGLGLYGSGGLMGGSGVGLGYALGSQAPALFVNASNLLGVGHASSATLLSDATLPVQVATAANSRRFVSFNDGAAAKFLLGFANNSAVTTSGGSFYGGVVAMPQNTPLLIAQNGADVAALRSGAWLFGPRASTSTLPSATVAVTDSPAVIASSSYNAALNVTVNTFAQTSTLLLNNTNSPTDLYSQSYLYSRLTFANNAPTFHIDANAGAFAIRDASNTLDVLSYSTTTKATTFTNQLKASSVVATGSATNAYQYAPAVSHVETLPGCSATVTLGTVSASLGLPAILGGQSVNNAVSFVIPVRAMTGQSIANFSMSLGAGFNQAVSCYVAFKRYDTVGNFDNVLWSRNLTIPANLASPYVITSIGNGTLNNESSTPENCWYIELNFTSTAYFAVYIQFIKLYLTTPALTPQRQ